MQTERKIRLFRNGRNQALRIPREFELAGNEATIYKEGEKLIIEPVKKKKLSELLASWNDLDEDIPVINDPPVEPRKIF